MTEPESDFPDKGILWREWNDETLAIIAERDKPVLLFVVDPDPVVYPFLRELFRAMPRDPKLRTLLHDFCTAVLVKADAVPSWLKELGAGTTYHVAVLSPQGLNPLVVIDPTSGQPHEVASHIVRVLDRLEEAWL